jgi:hypothetical protein
MQLTGRQLSSLGLNAPILRPETSILINVTAID